MKTRGIKTWTPQGEDQPLFALWSNDTDKPGWGFGFWLSRLQFVQKYPGIALFYNVHQMATT